MKGSVDCGLTRAFLTYFSELLAAVVGQQKISMGRKKNLTKKKDGEGIK